MKSAFDVVELRPGVLLVPDHAYPAAYTLKVDGTDQSYVDLDDPRRLEFDYMQRLGDLVDVLAPAGERLRVVHVGGAALTLPRYVAATRPQSAQVVLEPDAELTAFVRERLPLPRHSGIKVRSIDGRSGVAELRDSYADLLVVDAFVGARTPAELTTAEFLADCARVVGPTGLVVINVTDRGPSAYGRRVSAGFAATFDHLVLSAEPATLKGRRFGNILIAGSAEALPVLALAERAGRSPYPYRVLHGARLTQLVGSHAPFTVTDHEPSPPPPDGRTHFA